MNEGEAAAALWMANVSATTAAHYFKPWGKGGGAPELLASMKDKFERALWARGSC